MELRYNSTLSRIAFLTFSNDVPWTAMSKSTQIACHMLPRPYA